MSKLEIRPIKTEGDYRAALTGVERPMDAEAETPDGDRLEVLVTLIESYETCNYPLDLPDAIAAIEYSMERGSLTVNDLADAIGRPNRVYEILNGRRPLTLTSLQAIPVYSKPKYCST